MVSANESRFEFIATKFSFVMKHECEGKPPHATSDDDFLRDFIAGEAQN